MRTVWCRWCAHPEEAEFLPEECPRCGETMRADDWLDDLPLSHNDRKMLAHHDALITRKTVTEDNG